MADRDDVMTFYPPSNPKHVSFSVNNPSEKSNGVKLTTYRLETIMRKLGHNKIDLLKMDIEGCEYSVLNDIIFNNYNIDQILVEFHHRRDKEKMIKTIKIISELQKQTYMIFYISTSGEEYSFIKRNL